MSLTREELYKAHGDELRKYGAQDFMSIAMGVPPEYAEDFHEESRMAIGSSSDGHIPNMSEEIATAAVNMALRHGYAIYEVLPTPETDTGDSK